MIFDTLQEKTKDFITNGYVWNPDMDFNSFCDHNNFPTYSDDVFLAFEDIKNKYVEFMYHNN